MFEKTVQQLELTACKEIIASYRVVLSQDYNNQNCLYRNWSWFKSDMSSFRYSITGTFYRGKHARYWVTDFFAGGATNNLFFNCSPHNYGNFIYFLDALCTHIPSNPDKPFDADLILGELEKAVTTNDTENFKSIVEKYKQYVPTKCFYDLQADIEGNADYYNSEDRQVETRSRRWSKLLSIGYAVCQCAIEVMGFSFFLASVAMGLGIITVGVGLVALAAFSINYAVSRKYTKEMFDKILSGHFFERNVGTEENPVYESLNRAEIAAICLLSILPALLAAPSVYLLGVSSVIALPWLLAYALPLLLVVPFVMIFSHSAYKFIEEKGWEKLKEYFVEHFSIKKWYDVPKILLWEIPKLLISLLISGIIFYANYGMLFGKGVPLLGPVAATIAASAYAGVKSLFCVSKTSEVIASSSDAVTDYFAGRDVNEGENKEEQAISRESIKNTKQVFNAFQTSASRCKKVTPAVNLVTLGIHCGSEAGLIMESPTGSKGEAITKAAYSFFTSIKAIFKPEHQPENDTVTEKSTLQPKK